MGVRDRIHDEVRLRRSKSKDAQMLDGETKTNIIREYRLHERDTGSAEIQVAVLTEDIKRLTQHLRTHRKDVHSQARPAGNGIPKAPTVELPEQGRRQQITRRSYQGSACADSVACHNPEIIGVVLRLATSHPCCLPA